MGVPIWRRAHSQEQYLEEKPEPDEDWKMYTEMCCVVRIPGTLSLVWNVLRRPLGVRVGRGILKMKTCQQARVQIVTFHTLLRLQPPWPALYPATQYFTQLEKLSIYIGRNPRNAQVDKWTKILLIGNHCQEFRVLTQVTATTLLPLLDVIGTVVISSIYVALGQV